MERKTIKVVSVERQTHKGIHSGWYHDLVLITDANGNKHLSGFSHKEIWENAVGKTCVAYIGPCKRNADYTWANFGGLTND